MCYILFNYGVLFVFKLPFYSLSCKVVIRSFVSECCLLLLLMFLCKPCRGQQIHQDGPMLTRLIRGLPRVVRDEKLREKSHLCAYVKSQQRALCFFLNHCQLFVTIKYCDRFLTNLDGLIIIIIFIVLIIVKKITILIFSAYTYSIILYITKIVWKNMISWPLCINMLYLIYMDNPDKFVSAHIYKWFFFLFTSRTYTQSSLSTHIHNIIIL